MLVLRIPNFSEPYWYGDEGIYLTIGNGLRQGEKLYSEIIDHKTPIIYYLAMVPSQMYFRVLLVFWMIAATTSFHHLAKIIFKDIKIASLATFTFITLTTLPWFEGHIPNGELFVMGFILVGSYFLSKTKVFNDFFEIQSHKVAKSQSLLPTCLAGRRAAYLLLTGSLFGLAILTKVPAIFDVTAFLAIFWFSFTNQLDIKKLTIKKTFTDLKPYIKPLLLVLAGVLAPIIFSIIYFVMRGSGQAYLDFGLLYNFRYAGNWDLGITNQVVLFFTTLPGKLSFLLFLLALLSLINPALPAGRLKSKIINQKLQFIAMWFALALVGSTLSNRPYPHYFLQVIPALALLVGSLAESLVIIYKMATKQKTTDKPCLLIPVTLISIFIWTLFTLGVRPYETKKYYSQFMDMVTGKISREEYRNSFNYLMEDNYTAAEIIKEENSHKLFIWGTNPMLYALTQTSPTGRFTVSFHIRDFDAYDETYQDLVKAEPMFIVVMKDEDQPFPELFQYLGENYIPNKNFKHFTLWKRQATQ